MIENVLTMRLDGGQLPEHGRKSAQSTDALVNTNRKLTITGPVLLEKMEAALTQATEMSETIESLGSGELKLKVCELLVQKRAELIRSFCSFSC